MLALRSGFGTWRTDLTATGRSDIAKPGASAGWSGVTDDFLGVCFDLEDEGRASDGGACGCGVDCVFGGEVKL
jgi:hypothetical protein